MFDIKIKIFARQKVKVSYF